MSDHIVKATEKDDAEPEEQGYDSEVEQEA
jgi:hypothetical protein